MTLDLFTSYIYDVSIHRRNPTPEYAMPPRVTEADIRQFRDKLCAAAERAFAARGLEGVTMRELAAAVGCSPMTPYRYFRDKEEILAAVRAAAFDRFAARLEAANSGPGDAAARARAVGEAYLRFAFAEPQAYRLMFDLTQPDEDGYPELARAGGRARRTMTAYTEALAAEGLIASDPTLLGYVFWAALHGLVVLRLAAKLPAKPDFDAIHAEMMRLIIRGARSDANVPDKIEPVQPVKRRKVS
jgi:AcrR family transcriptional regulator